MNRLLAVVAGGFFGAFLGIVIPVSGAFLYIQTGGDPTATGAFSFFPIFLVPILAIVFATIGFVSVSKTKNRIE